MHPVTPVQDSSYKRL